MYGWKFMYRLGEFSGELTESAAAMMLAESGPEKLTNVCFEGSESYDNIRANITRRTRKDTPAPEPAPAPMPEPVPAPAPVPAPKPAQIFHAKYNDILTLVKLGMCVYLHGPAGSGKNVICEQVAEALGLDFYYTNTVYDKTELTGYKDAMGVYQSTAFYKAYKYGGLFMLDEVDVSIPEALTSVNGALSCKYFDFWGEMVPRHENFRCICAGNTCGTGATEEYNTRAKMDESTRNRFAIVPVDYCPAIETKSAGGDTDIVSFVRDLRESAKKNNISIITGYRVMRDLAAVKNTGITIQNALEYLVFKGMDKDERNILFSGLNNPANKYAAAMCY
ncbi:MAG: AAA family ATPase [Clostridia bacterium]|nr:AAA family ATPase [Clostridia bacterium]